MKVLIVDDDHRTREIVDALKRYRESGECEDVFIVDSLPSDFLRNERTPDLRAYDDRVKLPRSERIPHLKRGGYKK